MVHAPWLLAALLASPPGPGDGPSSSSSSSRTSVLVMHLVARDGASQSNASALAQVLGSVLAERKDLEVMLYEPSVYVSSDPLVGVLARCEETRCAMELGRRLGFAEVVTGTLVGPDPSRMTVARISAEDGRVVSTVESILTDEELQRVTTRPELLLNQLYAPSGGNRAPTPVTRATGPVGARPAPPAAFTRSREIASRDAQPWRAWLRLFSAAALGAALTGVGAWLVGVLAYNLVVVADMANVSRTGRHALTLQLARMIDGGFVVFMVASLWVVPMGVAAVAGLVASWVVP